jgi:hypothetical protein
LILGRRPAFGRCTSSPLLASAEEPPRPAPVHRLRPSPSCPHREVRAALHRPRRRPGPAEALRRPREGPSSVATGGGFPRRRLPPPPPGCPPTGPPPPGPPPGRPPHLDTQALRQTGHLALRSGAGPPHARAAGRRAVPASPPAHLLKLEPWLLRRRAGATLRLGRAASVEIIRGPPARANRTEGDAVRPRGQRRRATRGMESKQIRTAPRVGSVAREGTGTGRGGRMRCARLAPGPSAQVGTGRSARHRGWAASPGKGS